MKNLSCFVFKVKNKFMPGVLTVKTPKNDGSSAYASGSKEEALYYASFAFLIWQDLKGAVAFLKKHK